MHGPASRPVSAYHHSELTHHATEICPDGRPRRWSQDPMPYAPAVSYNIVGANGGRASFQRLHSVRSRFDVFRQLGASASLTTITPSTSTRRGFATVLRRCTCCNRRAGVFPRNQNGYSTPSTRRRARSSHGPNGPVRPDPGNPLRPAAFEGTRAHDGRRLPGRRSTRESSTRKESREACQSSRRASLHIAAAQRLITSLGSSDNRAYAITNPACIPPLHGRLRIGSSERESASG